MNSSQSADERLLKEILRRASATTGVAPGTKEHFSDESLAQFAVGALDEHERAELVAHLSECSHCRQVASALAIEVGKIDAAYERRSTVWLLPPRAMFALAASLLLAAGLWLVISRDAPQLADQKVVDEATQLLAAGDFDKVEAVIENAARDGITSPRLTSLESQAVRKLRTPLALAQLGRLSDFGYGLDGSVARGSAVKGGFEDQLKAHELLFATETQELSVLLNRGHLQLSMNHQDEAVEEFQAATKLAPEESLGWLGLGLARYLQDDFSAAEIAFRKALDLDPKSLSTRMNLAMTLDELNQRSEALRLWQAVLADEQAATSLTPDERKQVQQNIQRLSE